MNEKLYHVTWEIQVNANDHIDAATTALEVLRDPESDAKFFKVKVDGTEDTVLVNLKAQDEEE